LDTQFIAKEEFRQKIYLKKERKKANAKLKIKQQNHMLEYILSK